MAAQDCVAALVLSTNVFNGLLLKTFIFTIKYEIDVMAFWLRQSDIQI